jgi:anti-sigma B factor antagonist
VSGVVPFRLAVARSRRDVARVELEGELDVYTAPELDELLDALPAEVTSLLVDLTRVTFIDSAGLGLLTKAVKRLAPGGGRVAVVVDTESIRKIFEITGLARYFELSRSVEEAEARLT